ncbi:phosphatidate cytidylyltransferase [Paludibaculum fermentans]|uniref:phosphatidate cytidylyltransferase n=1 Tax=Paludibaculum fermentans TaxID=1473598 RepID=UPI003EBDD6B5
MKRLLTGLIITPFFFYAVVFAPDWFFLAVLAVVGSLCYYEYQGIVGAHFPGSGPDPRHSPIGYLAGVLLLVLPNSEALYLTLFALLAWVLAMRRRPLPQVLPIASMSVLGVLYIFGAWRCAVFLHGRSPWWMLFGVAINWIGDTFAFYFGKNFGRHKLAPSISPGKSWEGTIASTVSSMALGALFLHWKFPEVALGPALLLCLAANVAGQVGDLCESAIKRGAGVKDSGNLLPGHGGWLDRVDSSLFSVPVVYWLLQQRWILP